MEDGVANARPEGAPITADKPMCISVQPAAGEEMVLGRGDYLQKSKRSRAPGSHDGDRPTKKNLFAEVWPACTCERGRWLVWPSLHHPLPITVY